MVRRGRSYGTHGDRAVAVTPSGSSRNILPVATQGPRPQPGALNVNWSVARERPFHRGFVAGKPGESEADLHTGRTIARPQVVKQRSQIGRA